MGKAAYFITSIIILWIMIFLDVYLVNAGAASTAPNSMSVNFAEYWTGSLFDWAGIICSNASAALLSYSLITKREVSEPAAGTTVWNWIWGVFMLAGLVFIYLG